MAEEEYEVEAIDDKAEKIEEKVDKKVSETPQQPQAQRKGIQIPAIPTERILKTLTDKDTMMQTLHDETLEPHVHLTILLLLVFILAIIIGLLGL